MPAVLRADDRIRHRDEDLRACASATIQCFAGAPERIGADECSVAKGVVRRVDQLTIAIVAERSPGVGYRRDRDVAIGIAGNGNHQMAEAIVREMHPFRA